MEPRPVKFFKNGRNKAVRFPREFEPAGDEGVMYLEGNKIVIAPREKKPSLAELLKTFETIDEEWPDIDDPPPEPFEL